MFGIELPKMPSGVEILMQQMGFDPEKFKAQILAFAKVAEDLKAQLNRIESKLDSLCVVTEIVDDGIKPSVDGSSGSGSEADSHTA